MNDNKEKELLKKWDSDDIPRTIKVNGLDHTFNEGSATLTEFDEWVNNYIVGFVNSDLEVIDCDVEEELAKIADDEYMDLEDKLRLLQDEKGWYSINSALFGYTPVPEHVENFCQKQMLLIDEFSQNAKIGDHEEILGFDCECLEEHF